MTSTIHIFEPSGILNAAAGNELRREISDIVNNEVEILLIDMSEVTFIDSSGLGALVAAMQSVRNAKRELFVCSINAQVQMLFELTKIDRVLNILSDREEFTSKVATT
ncbi:STAS domain-containing protein [Anabaena cylindrica UHCC 0172]|uniref:STAS domain-containing protein n=1 Tax=Anabaena cylindrica TaxID=1165 RepID=UPI002B1FCCB3|nr:STAS domain-containing protein [Anabaena cylindrica]MEA5552650.1 STAS domain-containing protein [Anabaena cylindrica UHCC 0172]